jgi:arsenite-transporting ATPase
MRILIFCGSGGSGVSTITAATAQAVAGAGRQTLAFGITRGLGRAFGGELGLEPVSVGPGLDAVEGHGGHGGPDEFRQWVHALLDWRGMDPELADDLAALPGVNHIGRLLEMQRLARSGEYECIVIDGAEVSQFLDLPAALEAAARWLSRLFAPRQQTVFEPFFRAFAGDYASAGDAVFEDGKELLTRLADVRDLFADPGATSARVVVSPDTGALTAVQDAASVFGLFGYNLDAVVVNRLLSDDVGDPFFDGMRRAQAEALAELSDLQGAPPVLRAWLAPEPPRGGEALADLADRLYSGDPQDFLAVQTEHRVERMKDHYLLHVSAPFAKKEELRLEEVEEGVAVHLNGRRCIIALPDVLYTEASSWSYDGRILKVVLDR